MGICFSNNALENASHEVELSSLEGQSMLGKVVYVYDGDTVHIVFEINNKLTKYICRLAHIDSPEIVPKNIADKNLRDKEIEAATKSRNYLIETVSTIKINNIITKQNCKDLLSTSKKLIWVKCLEFDKYGRLLVELYENRYSMVSINKLMIDNNYAVPYEGGTKKVFDINL
jgi:endonuclease YncB( thermonuclease family)